MTVDLQLAPKTKRAAGERGLWAYYYVVSGALDETAGWLP